MTPIASQRLHQIGVTKTSILIQDALQLDFESFKTKFQACFLNRTQDVQAALRCLVNGAQGSQNQQDHAMRLQIALRMQSNDLGFLYVPGPVIPPPLDSSQSITVKVWDATEKQLSAACFSGNFQDVQKILSAHSIDLNAKDISPDTRDQTHLYAACRSLFCKPEIVELLLMHRASTKVPSTESMSLPGHALVANFEEATRKIPLPNFDEYFGRISEIARLLRYHHADFHSMNRHGHSPLSELKHEPTFQHALKHPKYKDFCAVIADASATALVVEAIIPPQQAGLDPQVAAAYDFLRKNPKLPDRTSQSISELIWSENSTEFVAMLGRTPELAKQFPLVGYMDPVIEFKAETLELKFNVKQPTPIHLVLCNWPQDCTSNFEQPRVIWQWLLPFSGPTAPEDAATFQGHTFLTRGSASPVKSDSGGGALMISSCSWVAIEDEHLIDQLNQKKTSFRFGQHKYTLSPSFLVEHDASDMSGLGKGPICGYRVRWVPDCTISGDDDDNRDTGGNDDQFDQAVAQKEYQETVLPITADPRILERFSAVAMLPSSLPAANIDIGSVVKCRIPPPAMPQEPSRAPPPPVRLPNGWTQVVDPLSGRVYYSNQNVTPAITQWEIPAWVADSRFEQWFAANSFEPIPDQTINQNDPNPAPRILLRAQTSYCPRPGAAIENTGLAIAFVSNNELVARIEDGQFLRVMGPGQATIYATQAGNQMFQPAIDWRLPNSKQTINVSLMCEIDVAAPETRLKAAYPLLYTNLSIMLNLGPRDLRWSKDLKSVKIFATSDKGLILSAIWTSITGAHAVIERFVEAGTHSLKRAQKALLDKTNTESPKVPILSPVIRGPKKRNPLLDIIDEYLGQLQSECDKYIEEFVQEVNALVEANVFYWMENILNHAREPSYHQVICREVNDLLKSNTRATSNFRPDIRAKCLELFFGKKVQEKERSLTDKGKIEHDKFSSCRHVFRQFCEQILQRISNHANPFPLSTLIQDFMIHLESASRGLAFYKESASELIRSVMSNDVTSVTTATGSGKSTLMPLLLIAANIGIKRVAVTQPRRFAAFSIYETISKYHGHSIVGFSMAGEQVNSCAPIVYITDGLLRTQMHLDKEYSGFDCIIIDEVHERSENIDACVALLAKMKELNLRMPKVILSSATLDDKVIAPFTSAGCKFGKVETKVDSPFSREFHYPDVSCKASCRICSQLTQNTFTISMIKFFIKHEEEYLKTGPNNKKGQMLVFMPSTQEVLTTVEDLKALNINAHALFAGQDGRIQSDNLEKGTYFISTNIAETSLTFPNLQVVIDLGKVQRPRLITKDGTLLPAPLMETVDASLSTLKQRVGRVGRTCSGHYVALYPRSSLHPSKRPQHIQANLELFPTDSICFSLSKQLKLSSAITLSFPGQPIEVKPLGDTFITFPELGSKMMAEAFHASLRMGCSEDILMLAAFMMKVPPKNQNLVVNSGQKLHTAQPGQPLPSGDISILLTIMRMISTIVPVGNPQHPVADDKKKKAIAHWCSKHGLDAHSKHLAKAHLEFKKMEAFYLPTFPPFGSDHSKTHPIFYRVAKKSFDALGKRWNGFPWGRKIPDGSPDMRFPENFESRRLVRGSSIHQVIQALARGFPNNFYVHCAELDGPVNSYSRVADRGDGGDEEGEPMKTYYSLHSKSSLAKADKSTFTVMFAVTSMMFGSEMREVLEPFRLGALGIAEPCAVDALPDDPSRSITRRIALYDGDVVPSGCAAITHLGKKYGQLKGPAQSIIRRELEIRRSLRVVKEKIILADSNVKQMLQQPQHKQKLLQLKDLKDKNIFRPLKYMWKNLYQSELEIHVSNIDDLHILFTGRRQQLANFKKHIEFWGRGLRHCPALSFESSDVLSGIEFFRTPDPKYFGQSKSADYAAFKRRLHNITAEELSEEEMWEMTRGKDATRESRMEAVTRIALQTFDCRVVGGFVRDWIVNGERKHPPKHVRPRDWVEIGKDYEAKQPPDKPSSKAWIKWDFKDDIEVVPKDLDIELMTQYFDVNRFIQEVTDCGIVVDHHEHIPQRHIFLFDKETGPFTADFIEPHFAALHTVGDFDVNCMCVSRFPDQIGLKMKYTSHNTETLDVNKVIANCRQHQLVPMQHPTSSGTMTTRSEKMAKRGQYTRAFDRSQSIAFY